MANLGLADMLVRFIPSNIFSDLTGAAHLHHRSGDLRHPLWPRCPWGGQGSPAELREAVLTLQAIIMRLVQMIMALTPYGILALMTRVVAGSNAQDLWNLVELWARLRGHRHNVRHSRHPAKARRRQRALLFQTVWPVLTFAFTSQLRRHYSPERGDTG